MCSDLLFVKTKCALEDGLKDSCVLNICEICWKISIMEFTVKEVIVFRVATFLNEVLCQINCPRNIWFI